jgi:hypothetical protein
VHKGYEWVETEILQLQRLAVEGRSVGPWNGLASAAPVPVDRQQIWSAGVTELGEKVGGRTGTDREAIYQSVSRCDGVAETRKEKS